MEHLQSCPLLVLFMQIHDLASVENFGQKLSKWKHFSKTLKHFSSLLRLQSPFFGSVTQLVSSHMGGMNISLWNIRGLHFTAYYWRQNHLVPQCIYVKVSPCSAPQPLPLQHPCYYSFEPSNSIFSNHNFFYLIRFVFSNNTLLIHDDSIILLTLGWPNHPWLPGLLPDLGFKRYKKHKFLWDIRTCLNFLRVVWTNC